MQLGKKRAVNAPKTGYEHEWEKTGCKYTKTGCKHIKPILILLLFWDNHEAYSRFVSYGDLKGRWWLPDLLHIFNVKFDGLIDLGTILPSSRQKGPALPCGYLNRWHPDGGVSAA